MTILIFILILVCLILAHEFGHFIVAKAFKIRVDEFGIFFPPRIAAFKWGETEYSLNWLPFGGFVRIFGEDGEAESAQKNPSSGAPLTAKGFSASASAENGDGADQPASATEVGGEPIEVMNLSVVIKTDFAGTGDAVVHELEKLPKHARLNVHIVGRGTGPISKSDVELVGSGAVPGIILGFNVKADRDAVQLAERLGVSAATFSIIYELTKWLGEEIEKRRPRAEMEEKTGAAKLLKVFSTVKNKVVVGGRVDEGEINEGADIKIMRRDVEVGRGTITTLQTQKNATKNVEKGNEFGAMLKIDFEPAAGDTLEAFATVTK